MQTQTRIKVVIGTKVSPNSANSKKNSKKNIKKVSTK